MSTPLLLKKSASFVLAALRRHWALTVSRPCANLRRLIRRLAHLNVRTGEKSLSRQARGGRVKCIRFALRNCRLTASPARINVRHWALTGSRPYADMRRLGTLPAHRLAGAHKRGALYSSHRAPHYSSRRGPANSRNGCYVGCCDPPPLWTVECRTVFRRNPRRSRNTFTMSAKE